MAELTMMLFEKGPEDNIRCRAIITVANKCTNYAA